MLFCRRKACSKADLLSQRHQKELSLSQAKCMAAEKALQRSQQDVDDLRHETLKVIRGTSKFSPGPIYNHCSISKKKMIVSQLIKSVYVRRDYEITVEFNISFDDFHTLEYHKKEAP